MCYVEEVDFELIVCVVDVGFFDWVVYVEFGIVDEYVDVVVIVDDGLYCSDDVGFLCDVCFIGGVWLWLWWDDVG